MMQARSAAPTTRAAQKTAAFARRKKIVEFLRLRVWQARWDASNTKVVQQRLRVAAVARGRRGPRSTDTEDAEDSGSSGSSGYTIDLDNITPALAHQIYVIHANMQSTRDGSDARLLGAALDYIDSHPKDCFFPTTAPNLLLLDAAVYMRYHHAHRQFYTRGVAVAAMLTWDVRARGDTEKVRLRQVAEALLDLNLHTEADVDDLLASPIGEHYADRIRSTCSAGGGPEGAQAEDYCGASLQEAVSWFEQTQSISADTDRTEEQNKAVLYPCCVCITDDVADIRGKECRHTSRVACFNCYVAIQACAPGRATCPYCRADYNEVSVVAL